MVPCVLLSFDDEQILMWRGEDWKSIYKNDAPGLRSAFHGLATSLNSSGNSDGIDGHGFLSTLIQVLLALLKGNIN